MAYLPLGATYLPLFYRVSPYRLAEGMARSDALRGSLSGQGYLYQYALRFAALVHLLVSVWLAPTVSYCNRVMFTEVAARAMEARHRQMCAGPHETYEVERYDISGAPWAYGSVLDSFAGTASFGIVVNNERQDAGMLQVQLAGAAPNVGVYHYAFPSDCLPWSTHNGSFVIDGPVPPDETPAACAALAEEWNRLDRPYARGDQSGRARWLPGCPVRVVPAASAAIACYW